MEVDMTLSIHGGTHINACSTHKVCVARVNVCRIIQN